jgi:signal transduction histidine kinase
MPEEIRREFLNDIRRCTGTISFLVQSLLTISKLDANSIAMKSKKENVWEILNQCVNSTAVLAEIKNVEVINNCQEDVKIICDKRWLVEAITNIVKNSIEHTKEGGRVALTAQENRLYTKITIADNGVGIDEKDLPHIFERFYKGKNSAETSVGIGLALAKTIIEKNGGFISVTSQVGKGTTFVVKYFHNNK